MKESMARLLSRYDGMSLRERALLTAAATAAIGALAYQLFLNPAIDQVQTLRAKEIKLGKQLRQVDEQVGRFAHEAGADPGTRERKTLAEVRAEMDQVTRRIEQKQGRLVPADRMSEMFNRLLRGNPRLKLVSLRSLPPEPLTVEQSTGAPAPAVTARDAAAPDAAVPGNLYKHGMEITVQGDYFALMDYLAALERQPWSVLWGEVRLQADTYPEERLILTLYTLSGDREWLRV